MVLCLLHLGGLGLVKMKNRTKSDTSNLIKNKTESAKLLHLAKMQEKDQECKIDFARSRPDICNKGINILASWDFGIHVLFL